METNCAVCCGSGVVASNGADDTRNVCHACGGKGTIRLCVDCYQPSGEFDVCDTCSDVRESSFDHEWNGYDH
jgi:RecJ-like exonuclease